MIRCAWLNPRGTDLLRLAALIAPLVRQRANGRSGDVTKTLDQGSNKLPRHVRTRPGCLLLLASKRRLTEAPLSAHFCEAARLGWRSESATQAILPGGQVPGHPHETRISGAAATSIA
jgi:hypothetical protein